MTTTMLPMIVDKKTKFFSAIVSGKSMVFITRDKVNENVTTLNGFDNCILFTMPTGDRG
jgi:hypothetical protein